jgi:hypothetical protein
MPIARSGAVQSGPGAAGFVGRTQGAFTRTGLYFRYTRTQLVQAPAWPRRAQAAQRAGGPLRAPALPRLPGEQAWRARPGAAPATHSRARTGATRALPASIMRRSVELVWLAGPAGAVAPGVGFGTAAPAQAASAPSLPAAAPPAASNAGSKDAVMRATALDPVLANRLADEVIRRIDQRARIERERRGS